MNASASAYPHLNGSAASRKKEPTARLLANQARSTHQASQQHHQASLQLPLADTRLPSAHGMWSSRRRSPNREGLTRPPVQRRR
eukprot:scaffold7938_cov129-Isochrysis_galbana.AAC.1